MYIYNHIILAGIPSLRALGSPGNPLDNRWKVLSIDWSWRWRSTWARRLRSGSGYGLNLVSPGAPNTLGSNVCTEYLRQALKYIVEAEGKSITPTVRLKV